MTTVVELLPEQAPYFYHHFAQSKHVSPAIQTTATTQRFMRDRNGRYVTFSAGKPRMWSDAAQINDGLVTSGRSFNLEAFSSELIAKGGWSKLDANYEEVAAPSGAPTLSSTVGLLSRAATSAQIFKIYELQPHLQTDGTYRFSFSCFCKAVDGSKGAFLGVMHGSSNYSWADFNFETGKINSQGRGNLHSSNEVRPYIEDWGDGWYRVGLSYHLRDISGFSTMRVAIYPDWRARIVSALYSDCKLLVTGAQVSTTYGVGDFLPTNGVAVVGAPELHYVKPKGLNGEQGTVVTDFAVKDINEGDVTVLDVADGSGVAQTNTMSILYMHAERGLWLRKRISGVSYIAKITAPISSGDNVRAVLRWDPDGLAMAARVNDVVYTSELKRAGALANIARINIGGRGDLHNVIDARHRWLAAYGDALSSAQMQSLLYV